VIRHVLLHGDSQVIANNSSVQGDSYGIYQAFANLPYMGCSYLVTVRRIILNFVVFQYGICSTTTSVTWLVKLSPVPMVA
jgi:hypothetical protein